MKTELIITDCGDLVIELHGEFDALGSNEIRPTFDKVLHEKDPEHVFLDIHNVSFIDSSGVGAIVYLYKRLKENSRKLRISGAHGQPRELLELLRIHKAIPLVLAKGDTGAREEKTCVA